MDANRLFFVVGTGRCGTTLLQSMLSSHPRLYIPPELRYFGRGDPAVRFSDPLAPRQVEPYLRHLRRTAMDLWWHEAGVPFEDLEAAVRGGLRGAREIYEWLMQRVAAARGATQPRRGDKTPYYASMTDRILEVFPEAQFIHLYRDPRDVAASFLGQYWSARGTALRCAGMAHHTYRCMAQLEKRVGDAQYCAVRYESLVHDPEGELRRLCAFLGEAYDPAMLRFGERRDPGYLAIEESWKGMTQQALTDARIGRFAETLTPRQIWTIERLLGPQLTELGYAPAATGRPRAGWLAAFWGERLWRKVLRTAGLQRPLLDERAVLKRHLAHQRNAAAARAR